MSEDEPTDERKIAPPAARIGFEAIRERAYELWERHHRPAGFEVELWLMAERELRAEAERRLAGAKDEAGPASSN